MRLDRITLSGLHFVVHKLRESRIIGPLNKTSQRQHNRSSGRVKPSETTFAFHGRSRQRMITLTRTRQPDGVLSCLNTEQGSRKRGRHFLFAPITWGTLATRLVSLGLGMAPSLSASLLTAEVAWVLRGWSQRSTSTFHGGLVSFGWRGRVMRDT